LPGLSDFYGIVLLVTTSIHDCFGLAYGLADIEEELRLAVGETMFGLRAMTFNLRRAPTDIPRPAFKKENGRTVPLLDKDGNQQKTRDESWLVYIEPVKDWSLMRLAAGQRELVEALPEPDRSYLEPDWEDITHPGQTVAETERQMALKRQPRRQEVIEAEFRAAEEIAGQMVGVDEAPGFAPNPEEPPAVTVEEARRMWERVYRRAQARGCKESSKGLFQAHFEAMEDFVALVEEKGEQAVAFLLTGGEPSWPAGVVERALALQFPDPTGEDQVAP
jgi:hypothetical protein